MGILRLISLVFLGYSGLAQAEPRFACPPPNPLEPGVQPAPVSESLAELERHFLTQYHNSPRLKFRAFWANNTYRASLGAGEFALPPAFLTTTTRHLEIALERGYANFVFYSDLGHGHLLLPEKELAALPRNPSEAFEIALRSKNLKVLYHTAELVKLREGVSGPLTTDPWLAWRYHSRNFVADNVSGENLAVLFAPPPAFNTVRDLPGYRELGTFYVSGNESGCFSFTQGGRQLRFDLSFRR